MIKKLAVLSLIILTGCSIFHKKQTIPEFQYTIKPLDLSEYKNITITVTTGSVCMPYDDYTGQIIMLKKLSDYINYQRVIIIDMDNYYKSINK